MNHPSPLEEIFFAALEKGSPDDREAYLNEACAGDADLRGRLKKMLAAQVQAGSFLEKAAIGAGVDSGATLAVAPIAEQQGAVIAGRYKLIEEIGEGGMGTVWMAQQTQPVKRLVAVKLIKAGMDSRQMLARFEGERQALALMDHANITRVLDAGATESGRPFFVMDLVRGVPITDYCDSAKATIRQRLELFVLVCSAVQHAHQKGIIHRDLKPSNVLVTLHDGSPVPKVIDFGVAKAMSQSLTEHSLYTGFTQMIGTPAYMSPEQAEMSGLDVDTRSDVYSLGMLLYELLTGNLPFDRDTLKKAGLDEFRRVVREVEPVRPSGRVATLDGAALSTVSSRRTIEPRSLATALRGELDWIVMKSLEKDRTRRYESASSLAADVQRYLNDEPVLACPPSFAYRLRKVTRRHRVGLTACGFVAFALIAGAGISLWQAVVAKQARAEAVEQQKDAERNLKLAQKEEANAKRARAEAIEQRQDAEQNLELAREAVDKLIKQVDEGTLPRSPQFDGIRRALLQESVGFYKRLLAQKGTTPAVKLSSARAWRRIGEVEWDLGNREALDAFEKSFALLEELIARYPVEPKYMSELALGHRRLLRLQPGVDREISQKSLTRARNLRQALSRLEPQQLEHSFELIMVQAELDGYQGHAHDETWHRQHIAALRGFVAKDPKNLDWRSNLAFAQLALADSLANDDAAASEADALREIEETLQEGGDAREHRFSLAGLHVGKAERFRRRGELVEAEQSYKQAIAHYDELYRQLQMGHHNEGMRAMARIQLGEMLEDQGRFAEAEQLYEVALNERTSHAWGQPLFAVAHLASVLVKQQRNKDAAERLEGFSYSDPANELHERTNFIIVELLRGEVLQEEVVSVDAALDKLNIELSPALEKDLPEALAGGFWSFFGGRYTAPAFPRTAVAIEQWAGVRAPAATANALNGGAWGLVANADSTLSEPRAAIAVEWAMKATKLDPSKAYITNTLGVAYYRAERWHDAIDALNRAVSQGDKHASNWILLAMAHWRLNEERKARECFQRGVEWMDKKSPQDAYLGRIRAEAEELFSEVEPPAPE